MQKTLMTPREVIQWSRISAAFPTCDINDLQEAVRYEFETCLGRAFYEELLEDLHDYSGVKDWTGGSVAEGVAKVYNGVVNLSNTLRVQVNATIGTVLKQMLEA